MKRIVLSAALVMSVLVASAQTGSGTATSNSSTNYTSRVITDNKIRQIATQLQLNEAQYIKFRDLSRARNEQLREASNMYANDATALKSRVQTIHKDFETQLAQAVSQKQYSDYLASQGLASGGSQNQASGYGGSSLENAAVGTSVNGGAVNTNTDPNRTQIMNNDGMAEEKTEGNKRKNKAKNRKNKNN